MNEGKTFIAVTFNTASQGKTHLQDGTMLRSLLIYLSKAAWAQKLVTGWSFARRAASRFVAGEKIEDAIRVVRDLNENGINATLDFLGEHTSTAEEADKATENILSIFNEINRSGVCANVSIKLTQIGVGLDEEICRQNLNRLLEQVKKTKNFLRLDMEDSPYTDVTLSLHDSMVEQGFDSNQFGLVMQAYLFRAEGDLRTLLEKGTRLRLVKGAYSEPADKAYPKKVDTDANYDLLAKIMIDSALKIDSKSINADGRVPPVCAFATHDDKRIAFVRHYAEKSGLPKNAFEFQMLNGIRRDLQERLVQAGYLVRVYVPFGTQWYPYFMRRLAERPANIWFFVSNYFKG